MGNKFSSPGMIGILARCWITKGTFFLFYLILRTNLIVVLIFFSDVERDEERVVELKKSKENCKLKLFRATFQVDSGTEK